MEIKISQCTAVGPAFQNLTADSIHTVIKPPKGQNNSLGEWVMGVGEPVLVLCIEYNERYKKYYKNKNHCLLLK